MNVFDKAWKIIAKITKLDSNNTLTPDDFLKKLSFNPKKSKEENKEIMINEIAQGKFGPILAIGGRWLQKHKPSSQESKIFVENLDLEELEQDMEDIETQTPLEKGEITKKNVINGSLQERQILE